MSVGKRAEGPSLGGPEKYALGLSSSDQSQCLSHSTRESSLRESSINHGRSKIELVPVEPSLILPGEIINCDLLGDYPREGKLKSNIPGIMIQPENITKDHWKGQRIRVSITNDTQGLIYLGNSLATLDVNVNNTQVMWTQSIQEKRPKMCLNIAGSFIHGLIDTGADTSVLSQADFLRLNLNGPTEKIRVLGVGGSSLLQKVLFPIPWNNTEHSGTFYPIINPSLEVSLWGRDLLTQMHVKLTTDF